MQLLTTPDRQVQLAKVRRMMDDALDILDEIGAPADVGSHLDLAICRLEQHLGLDVPGAGDAWQLKIALEEALMEFDGQESEFPR